MVAEASTDSCVSISRMNCQRIDGITVNARSRKLAMAKLTYMEFCSRRIRYRYFLRDFLPLTLPRYFRKTLLGGRCTFKKIIGFHPVCQPEKPFENSWECFIFIYDNIASQRKKKRASIACYNVNKRWKTLPINEVLITNDV